MIGRLSMGRKGANASPAGDAAQVRAALRERKLHRAWRRIPIYLVIGSAGMGKSTLIERSGLDLDPPMELSSCNWWIGNEALLAEVTQDPARDGNHPVFALLRSLRPVVPVSGVVMVVSPADLTLADVGERTDMSAAQTRLLREFEAQFGYAPPVYFVVSKLDLTPGFAEFFDRLEPAERDQPWGFTLPVDLGRPRELEAGKAEARTTGPEKPLSNDLRARTTGASKADAPPKTSVDGGEPESVAVAFENGFRRLLDSVRTRVVQWISQETNVGQCERIVNFGAQVAALEIILKPMIEPLMPSDKRRWQGAYFRGIYLTSTQQDALSIDALLPEMAKRFALQRTGTRPPDLGRDDETLGYFVEGIFRRVILPEAGLVQRDNARARHRNARGWIAVAAVLILCAGLGLLSALSYRDGVARIAAIDEAVAAVGPTLTTADPARLPAILTGLDALSTLSDAPSASPPIVSLDTYAQALIAETGRGLYDRGLANSLAPHLDARLERDLVRPDASTESLRGALAAADRADKDGAYDRWLRGAGSAGLPPEARAALSRHADEANRLGDVPAVGPAFPVFARELLMIRDKAQ